MSLFENKSVFLTAQLVMLQAVQLALQVSFSTAKNATPHVRAEATNRQAQLALIATQIARPAADQVSFHFKK